MSIHDVAQPYAREVGLLLAAGLSSRDAYGCVARALEIGVSSLEQAIADRLATEEAAYHALADFLGLPFTTQRLKVAPDAPWPDAVTKGVAPLKASVRGWRFAIAPRGRTLAQLIAWDLRRPAGGLVMTTPTRLERDVIAACAAAAQINAAHDLPDQSPQDSFRNGLGARMTGALIAATAIGLTLLMWNAEAAVAIISLLVSILFFTNVVLRLAAVASDWPEGRDFPPLTERDLPIYTILVPLYREAAIAKRLAAALRALDYPPAKLDIKILLEADDDETRRAFEACDLPSWISLLVTPPGAPRTKPRALNVGLAVARGELLAVYDAEDRPDPQQLRLAAAMFAKRSRDRLACVQARLAIENADESWLTRLFALEYAALFGVLLPGFAAERCPIALGGTSNHFHVATLKEVGGWDAWNVTEDADLGLRLFRKGYHIGALNSVTWEEAPVTFDAWIKQRSRWLKGWMQTSIVHLFAPRRPLRERGAFQGVCGLAISLGAVLSALFGPLLIGFALAQAFAGPMNDALGPFNTVVWSLALVLMVAGFVSMIAPPWAAVRRDGLGRLAPWVALLPFYYLLITVAAWRALAEFAVRPHHWNKTTHGVSRTLMQPPPSNEPPADHAPQATASAEPPLRENEPFG